MTGPDDILGAIVTDRQGRPFYGYGGNITVYPTVGRAAAVAAAWAADPAFAALAPLRTAGCRVRLGGKEGEP